jgi:N-hydroxyarylamine O-acetyltransferase
MPLPPDFGEALDLVAYFNRIGYEGHASASLPVLEELCLRHVGAIPFENLDPLAGVPVSLDLDALQAKLVRRRRGGYCFEHNLLFAAVLCKLGFTVALLEARVGAGSARTHGVLRVEAEARPWLTDVGFGADGLLGPVPMDGTEVARFGERWRLGAEEGEGRMEADLGAGWQELYRVQFKEVLPVDWVVANHYTGTHPESRFVRGNLTVQTTAPGRRRMLRGSTLTLGGVARQVAPEEVPALVREGFGLDVPEALVLRLAKTYKEWR